MTERAKEITAEINAVVEQTGRYTEAVAAVLAPLFERVEALEARGRAEPPLVTMHSNTGFTSQKTYPDTSPPAPVPQPGATRGAEVAEKMIETFAANVRWICTKAIDAERAAARKDALAEAEGAVRQFPSAVLHRGVFNEIADAIAKLKYDATKKPTAE